MPELRPDNPVRGQKAHTVLLPSRGPKNDTGFTLLELSVVLAIIAVVVAGTLSMGSSMISSAKLVNTNNKLDAIEKALMAYRIANNRLPCPSDPTLTDIPVTPATYGYEAGAPGNCTYTNGAYTMPHYSIPSQSNGGPPSYTPATTNYQALGMSVVEGAVPVKTLGLPDEFQFDGWGKKFAYAVAAPMTAIATTAADGRIAAAAFVSYGAAANCGAITVQNGGGNNRTQVADYVLLSYGSDGHGGYLKSGAQYFMGSDNSGEQANCHCTATAANNASYTATYIQEDPFQTTSTDALSAFDDIVRYKERWQMQNDYDKYHPGSQLPCTPGFQVQAPIGSGGWAGYSVATGDVNGDGIADIIIGAPSLVAAKGAVYVVFGTRAGFPDPLPLSSLNGTNGFELDGTANNGAGNFVATGDFNGDGIADIIIGADSANSYAGYTYVVFGGQKGANNSAGTAWTSCPCTLTIGSGNLIDGTQGVRFDGPSGDLAGASIAAGDVNGDGYADLIIGAPWANGHNGATFVVFGQSGGWGSAGNVLLNVGNNTVIDGTHGIRFDAVDMSGNFVTAGDINGDGIPDIVIGAGNYTYVIFSKNTKTTTFLPTTTITTTANSATAIVGSSAGLQVGQSLSGSTIPAGAYISACSSASNGTCQSTSLTLSSGSGVAAGTNTSVTVATTPLNIGPGTLINGTTGVQFSTSNGYALATGDINGDGIADLIIGDRSASSQYGHTYVVFGKRTTPWSVTGNLDLTVTGYGNLIDGTQGIRFDGVSAFDDVGSTVATGDINGDGTSDLVIGACGFGNATGFMYVIFGNGAILPSTTVTTTSGSASATLASYTGIMAGQYVTSPNIPANTKISSCTGGTVCTGTLTLSNNATVTGSASFTVATMPLNIGAGTFINGTTGARFDGASSGNEVGAVATGDLNGDGIPDLIIGASIMNSGDGYVYIYNGRASGWPVPSGGAGFNLGGL